MLSRMLPSAKRAATGRTLVGRFPITQLQAASFHAGPVLRNEEKAEAPAEKSNFFIDSLGDWHRAVPMGVAMAIPACSMDVYMVNEETQLMCCFMLFIGSAYSLGGNAVGAFFDEKAEAIIKEHHAAENVQIEAAKVALEAHKSVLTAEEDISAMAEVHHKLAADMVKAENMRLQHEVRDGIVAKLDFVAASEAAQSAKIQSQVVETATNNVVKNFTEGDAKMKNKALTYAMDALAGKSVGADIVSTMFSEEVKTLTGELAAKQGTTVKLSAEESAAISEELKAVKRRFNIETEIPKITEIKYE